MSFSKLDLTSVNAANEKGAELVFRRPKLFKAEEKDGVVLLSDGSGQSRKISKAIFDSKFIKWNEDGQLGYCIRPRESYAVEIKSHFSILEEGFDGEAFTRVGSPGDYLITRESGVNEICKKNDFNRIFIRSAELSQEISKDIEMSEMTI